MCDHGTGLDGADPGPGLGMTIIRNWPSRSSSHIPIPARGSPCALTATPITEAPRPSLPLTLRRFQATNEPDGNHAGRGPGGECRDAGGGMGVFVCEAWAALGPGRNLSSATKQQ